MIQCIKYIALFCPFKKQETGFLINLYIFRGGKGEVYSATLSIWKYIYTIIKNLEKTKVHLKNNILTHMKKQGLLDKLQLSSATLS